MYHSYGQMNYYFDGSVAKLASLIGELLMLSHDIQQKL